MAITYLFPGQGSQKVGMGADLFNEFEASRERFSQANDILGRDLQKLCFEGPHEELTDTQNTQPALFTVEAIICDILGERGIKPSAALGHSLGEYSALYAAGVYSFEDGLRIVAKRGALMAEAGVRYPGAMAAVLGLENEQIAAALASVQSGVVVPANENSPDQTVISGEVRAVEDACEQLRQAGAKRVVPLPVSGAFHSPLMQSAADELESFLDGIAFQQARCPVICNVTADARQAPDKLRALLIEQLTSPVRWVDSMAFIEREGLVSCVEAGPGNVLRGLARKCSREIKVVPCDTVDNLYSLLNSRE